MVKLIHSEVEFNELEHTYKYKDKIFKGITWILSRYLFPDKYKNIPKSVLDKAKERGSEVHSEVQMIVEGFKYSTLSDDARAFVNWTIANKREFIASEFIVSDKQTFASAVDIIDSDGNLYDIKTTSTLDEEYCRWQLNVYAYLMKLQCGFTPEHLYAVHLRNGQCKVVEVATIEESVIMNLLECARNEEEMFDNPLISKSQELAQSSSDLVEKCYNDELVIVKLKQRIKIMEEAQERLKSLIMEQMNANNVNKIETERLLITLKKAYTRTTFDTSSFKKDSPEVYEAYTKETPVKESVTIKIKDIC